MRKRLSIFAFFVAIIVNSFGQSDSSSKSKSSNECEADLYVIQTPLLSRDFWGINYNLKIFPDKHFGTGVHMVLSRKEINDSFHYVIKKPVIIYVEIGWVNQYNYIQTRKIRMDISMVNCLAVASLCDDAIRKGKYPKEIVSNYFYALEPGMGISFNLSKGKRYPGCWLSTEYDYRFIIGGMKYASPNQFPGNLFKIGLSIIGPS